MNYGYVYKTTNILKGKNRGKPSQLKGIKLSEEHKIKLSEAHKGIKRPECSGKNHWSYKRRYENG